MMMSLYDDDRRRSLGARPLKRVVERWIMTSMSKLLFQGVITEGSKTTITAVDGRCDASYAAGHRLTDVAGWDIASSMPQEALSSILSPTPARTGRTRSRTWDLEQGRVISPFLTDVATHMVGKESRKRPEAREPLKLEQHPDMPAVLESPDARSTLTPVLNSVNKKSNPVFVSEAGQRARVSWGTLGEIQRIRASLPCLRVWSQSRIPQPTPRRG
eukprot:767812-Hanusia_phi.AAC.2